MLVCVAHIDFVTKGLGKMPPKKKLDIGKFSAVLTVRRVGLCFTHEVVEAGYSQCLCSTAMLHFYLQQLQFLATVYSVA